MIQTQSTNQQTKKQKHTSIAASVEIKTNKPVAKKSTANLDMLDDFTCVVCRYRLLKILSFLFNL